jgi:hypothetical protein
MILAEDAPKVARREEDITRSVYPGDRWFLTEMRAIMRYQDLGSGTAEAAFSGISIHPALSRAYPAKFCG